MENLNKRPSKGILRFSESSRSNSVDKDIKWDETNIKETLHPDDKDYGFMRIDEPPTPYSHSPHGQSCENSDEEDLQTKTNQLLEKVSKKIKEPPVTIENVEGLLDESDLDAIEKRTDIDEEMAENGAIPAASTSHSLSCSNTTTTNCETTSRASGSFNVSDFELKRKRHYNEYYAVKLAKKLMEKEIANDDDDDSANADDEDRGGTLDEH